jgi:hypothetical protein
VKREQTKIHNNIDTISAAIQRIKEKQKVVVEETDSKVEMFKRLAESEA